MADVGAGITLLTGIFKQLYPKGLPLPRLFEDHPFFQRVKKVTSGMGLEVKVPINLAGNPLVSHDESEGLGGSNFLSLTGTSGVSSFVFTWDSITTRAVITLQAIRASQSDMGAFVRATKNQIEGSYNGLKMSIGRECVIGNRAIATVASASNYTVTLADPATAVSFWAGQRIQFSSDTTGSGGSVRGGTQGYLTIASVDIDAGTITTVELVTVVTSITAGDGIYLKGNYGAAMLGVADWIPDTVTATAFGGVDRTKDPLRLAGNRITVSGSKKDGLTKALNIMASRGAQPDLILMNYLDWQDLNTELQNKQLITGTPKDGKIGFSSLILGYANGTVEVVAERFVPTGRAYILQMDTWELYSLGAFPGPLTLDGQASETGANVIPGANSYEYRFGGFAQLGCLKPGANGVVIFS